MARMIGRLALLCAVAAGLAWADWPAQAAGPATVISRLDVAVTVVLLAALPALVARRFGPVGGSWLARTVRLAGCAGVVALVLVKAHVKLATVAGGVGTAGIWAGEIIFLIVLAAYLAGLLAVTARRPPAGRAAVTAGVGAGALAGVIMYVLPPRGSSLHIASASLAEAYKVARVLAVPLVLAAGIAAGVRAARRTSRRKSANARARQGGAAGLCAGVAAAMIVSLLGISTIALVPRDAKMLEWTLPGQHQEATAVDNGSVYNFEVSVSEAGAGYLLVLLFFPLLGAGLGAWGGLYGADRPGRQAEGGGGGGGGGPRDPDRTPPPPTGGRQLDRRPQVDIGRLLSMPEWQPVAPPPDRVAEPSRRQRSPSGRADPPPSPGRRRGERPRG
ncbi:MAG TPA: hypothetical protein VEL03_09930 [Streptosporangiaceae bacterium]|nr:hypothetical protein [Streptosporangiaceae bacterium]